MPAVGTTTLAELEVALRGHRPLLSLGEIHALFLGALTSTSTSVRPQSLLPRIFGDDPFASAKEPPMALLMALFGYWNHLAGEQEAGRVRLAPRALPEGATQAMLGDHTRARLSELDWYFRGIDTGGDHPSAFGRRGEEILSRLAEASAFFEAFRRNLDDDELNARQLSLLQADLGMLEETVEGLLADLMVIGNRVRLEALSTFRSNRGRRTDDGPVIARSPKVSRNAPCPCGSGKKYKKCCWLAEQPLH